MQGGFHVGTLKRHNGRVMHVIRSMASGRLRDSIVSRSQNARKGKNSKVFPFLRLPTEIRLAIYRMLLKTQYCYTGKHLEWYKFTLAILLVNRKINQEATQIYLNENLWIHVMIDVPAWHGCCIESAMSPMPHFVRHTQDVFEHTRLKIDLRIPGHHRRFLSQQAPNTYMLMGSERLAPIHQRVVHTACGNVFACEPEQMMMDLTMNPSPHFSLACFQVLYRYIFSTIGCLCPVNVYWNAEPSQIRTFSSPRPLVYPLERIFDQVSNMTYAAASHMSSNGNREAALSAGEAGRFYASAISILLDNMGSNRAAFIRENETKILKQAHKLDLQYSVTLIRVQEFILMALLSTSRAMSRSLQVTIGTYT